jgi:hypothetical protein
MTGLPSSPETAAGLVFGLLAVATSLAVAFARRATRGIAVVGLLFAAAVALGLRQTLGLPGGLAVGLVALAGAGLAADLPVAAPLAPVLAVVGAWLVVTRSGLAADNGLLLLVGVAIVVGGFLLADFDARWRRQGLGPVLVAISVVGIYTTVPDTEQAMVALGAALPLAFLGWPWPLGSLGRAGAYAAIGALLWVVAAGGVGRGSSVVGGIACLGLLVVEPTARLLDPGRGSVLECLPRGRWGAVAAATLHLGLVYVAARVAGLRSTVAEAAVIASALLAAAVVLAVVASTVRSHLVWSRRPPLGLPPKRRRGENSDLAVPGERSSTQGKQGEP